MLGDGDAFSSQSGKYIADFYASDEIEFGINNVNNVAKFMFKHISSNFP